MPESGSGVVLRDWSDFGGFVLSWSQNVNAEENPWIDEGDSRIVLLTNGDVSSFHGGIIRGKWEREWGRSGRLALHAYGPDSLQRAWREIPIPFQEMQLSGSFIIGILPELMQQFPSLAWVALPYYGITETISCRGDTLTAHWQR
jgi:hypothetical protein